MLKSRAGQFGLFAELKQMDEEQPPTVEGLGGGNVTVKWLVEVMKIVEDLKAKVRAEGEDWEWREPKKN